MSEVRPVDANALKELVNGNGDFLSMARLFGAIDAAQTLDVAPVVRGAWELAYPHFSHRARCTLCGHLSDTMYNFCPNCGADMREGGAP